MRRPPGATLSLTLVMEDADAVSDALSYWLSAADNNFGQGYDLNTPEGNKAAEDFVRVKRVSDRIENGIARKWT